MRYQMRMLTPEQEEQKHDILIRIGLNLRRLRLARGYSMEFMAREMFTTYRTYAGWEKAEVGYNIPAYALVIAGKTLKVPMREFFDNINYAEEKISTQNEKEEIKKKKGVGER